MTRAEFIDTFKHELAGFVCDAAVQQRAGSELALWLRGTMKRLDAILGVAYDALKPEPAAKAPAANGKPDQPARKT